MQGTLVINYIPSVKPLVNSTIHSLMEKKLTTEKCKQQEIFFKLKDLMKDLKKT